VAASEARRRIRTGKIAVNQNGMSASRQATQFKSIKASKSNPATDQLSGRDRKGMRPVRKKDRAEDKHGLRMPKVGD
jgi:hypothetical protein